MLRPKAGRSGKASVSAVTACCARRFRGYSAGSSPVAALGKSEQSRDNRHMIGMMRDHWWWPWWVSTLIDIGIVVLAVLLLRRTSRRYVRAAALVVALAAVVAAVMAPIVMTDKPNHMKNTPMMP